MSRELGKRVLSRRTRLGLSQTKLAEMVHMTHGWVSMLEHNKLQTTAEKLTELAVALGEPPEEYLRLAGRTLVHGQAPAIASVTLTQPQIEALLERAATLFEERVREVLKRP